MAPVRKNRFNAPLLHGPAKATPSIYNITYILSSVNLYFPGEPSANLPKLILPRPRAYRQHGIFLIPGAEFPVRANQVLFCVA